MRPSRLDRGLPADPLPVLWARWLLRLFIVIYWGIGTLYVLRTPLWQVPDEPAHVNYALHVARTGTLPVLQPGDYDAEYLERIKAARFPPEMSVASIRYESHQPPLYYLLAALVLRLVAPISLAETSPPAIAHAVYAIRFLSLLLSVGMLYAAHALMRRLFPTHPSLALAAVGFIAFIPQHVAMMAGANNDALAELVLALVLWRLVHDLQKDEQGWRSSIWRGGLLGLVLLTKTTVYLPALLAWVTFHVGTTRGSAFRAGKRLLGEGIVALILALPFYVRNLLVYGWPDILGLRRHAEVVVGQLTTAEFIAREGWTAFWQRAITWTFRSFWGQFGWMGVLMDARVYRALAYFSLVLAVALLVGVWHYRASSGAKRVAGNILLAAAAGTVVSYIGYNLSFLQHQGRYLFTMLVPLAAFLAPGMWLLMAPARARWAAAMAAAATALALVAALLDLGPFDRWDALALFGLAVWFVLAWRWPRWRPLWVLAPFVLLAVLDIVALYRFILPALAAHP